MRDEDSRPDEDFQRVRHKQCAEEIVLRTTGWRTGNQHFVFAAAIIVPSHLINLQTADHEKHDRKKVDHRPSKDHQSSQEHISRSGITWCANACEVPKAQNPGDVNGHENARGNDEQPRKGISRKPVLVELLFADDNEIALEIVELIVLRAPRTVRLSIDFPFAEMLGVDVRIPPKMICCLQHTFDVQI